MSARWLTERDAEDVIELAIDMAGLIDELADLVDEVGGNSKRERALVASWEALYARIDAAGTYPSAAAAAEADPADRGYWVFTRPMLDRLCTCLDPQSAAIVVQALDSRAARAYGLHILPRRR